jgi:hypothetical protein
MFHRSAKAFLSFRFAGYGILAAICLTASGCGIHYFDSRTGTEHVWGFGHLCLRAQPATNSVQAVVKGYSIVGLKAGGSEDDYGVCVGYDSRRFIYVSPSNAAFALEWPNASFLNVRVGDKPFFLTESIPIATSNLQTNSP